MKVVKGLNKDMTCRGFKFEVGKPYTEDEADLCHRGFHGCERPIDVLAHYPPNRSVYHVAELEEVTDQRGGDSKRCGRKITIGAAVDIPWLVEATINFNYENSDKAKRKHATGYRGAASAGHETAVAVAWGIEGKAKGVLGSHIVCAEWIFESKEKEWKLAVAKMAMVDGEIIKADTFYSLKDGEFVEAE